MTDNKRLFSETDDTYINALATVIYEEQFIFDRLAEKVFYHCNTEKIYKKKISKSEYIIRELLSRIMFIQQDTIVQEAYDRELKRLKENYIKYDYWILVGRLQKIIKNNPRIIETRLFKDLDKEFNLINGINNWKITLATIMDL
jgi:hypothetical protein